MHRGIFCLALLVGFIAVRAQERGVDFGGRVAQPRWEIGVVLGQPTGLSAKYWINSRSTIDGAVAYELRDEEDRVDLYADYQFNFLFLPVGQGVVPLYFGLGPFVELSTDEVALGARIPVGVQYFIPNARLSLFGELAPVLEVVPSSDVGIRGGVGIRLVF
jgi:hypothetical protein